MLILNEHFIEQVYQSYSEDVRPLTRFMDNGSVYSIHIIHH